MLKSKWNKRFSNIGRWWTPVSFSKYRIIVEESLFNVRWVLKNDKRNSWFNIEGSRNEFLPLFLFVGFSNKTDNKNVTSNGTAEMKHNANDRNNNNHHHVELNWDGRAQSLKDSIGVLMLLSLFSANDAHRNKFNVALARNHYVNTIGSCSSVCLLLDMPAIDSEWIALYQKINFKK